MSDFSQFTSPRQIRFLMGKILRKTDIYKPFCCVRSLAMVTFKHFTNGTFHYNIWDFSKNFHIFVRGVYKDLQYEEGTCSLRMWMCSTSKVFDQ